MSSNGLEHQVLREGALTGARPVRVKQCEVKIKVANNEGVQMKSGPNN